MLRHSPRNSAFSLVEVTMAIGIVGFCLLTLMGLLPTGLNALNDASRETTDAQIVQQIVSQAMLTPFSQIPKMLKDNSPTWYDEGGLKLTESNTRPHFEVSLEQLATVYPGSDQAADKQGGKLAESITTIRISIKPLAYGQEKSYVVNVSNSEGVVP